LDEGIAAGRGEGVGTEGCDKRPTVRVGGGLDAGGEEGVEAGHGMTNDEWRMRNESERGMEALEVLAIIGMHDALGGLGQGHVLKQERQRPAGGDAAGFKACKPHGLHDEEDAKKDDEGEVVMGGHGV